MIGVVMVSEENNILLPRPAHGGYRWARLEEGPRSPIAEWTISISCRRHRRRPTRVSQRLESYTPVDMDIYRSNRSLASSWSAIPSKLCCILLYIVIDTSGECDMFWMDDFLFPFLWSLRWMDVISGSTGLFYIHILYYWKYRCSNDFFDYCFN